MRFVGVVCRVSQHRLELLDRSSSLEGVIVGLLGELNPRLVSEEGRLEVRFVDPSEPLDQTTVVPSVDLLLLTLGQVDGVFGVLVLVGVHNQMLGVRVFSQLSRLDRS